eukprot:TRINITY_DN59583_c0_g1_i1.p1 TRINITY_DN59583_c0_g1~~TRINITY_DN59583_c0_g1_i1.p1  ORF type:complete len:663 (+),score=135.17 TRINITY_DN59583_c0_g1_i1:88-2076(+)
MDLLRSKSRACSPMSSGGDGSLKAVAAGAAAALAIVAVWKAGDVWEYVLRRKYRLEGWPRKPAPLRRRLKVAVLGAGLSGTSVALWLRDALGDVHDLDLVIMSDGPAGQGLPLLSLAGNSYESVGPRLFAGGGIYLQRLLGRFGLLERAGRGLQPLTGIFDGSDFLLCGVSAGGAAFGSHALAKCLTAAKMVRRFGLWACLRLWFTDRTITEDWGALRRALRRGAIYGHPREMLSVLGHGSLRLTARSAEQWLFREAGVSGDLGRVLVEPSLRDRFCGQGCSDSHAFAGLLGLRDAGLRLGSSGLPFGVQGGYRSLVQQAFMAAQPRVLLGSARVVRRIVAARPYDPCFEVGYDAGAVTADGVSPGARSRGAASFGGGASGKVDADVEGLLVEAFHVVVVAHPLERSTLRFEGCCGAFNATLGQGGSGAGTGAATSSGSEHALGPPELPASACGIPAGVALNTRRCVMHFVYGTLDLRRFSRDSVEAEAAGEANAATVAAVRLARRQTRGQSEEADGRVVEAPSRVPSQVWTTSNCTAPFYAVQLQLPANVTSEAEAKAILEAAEGGEPQVYRVLAPRALSEAEIDAWFVRKNCEPVRTVDWHGCPQFLGSGQQFRPFVLDASGVYYVNALEQAVPSTELSLMGARNAVNLVLDWVQRSGCF